MVRPVAETSKQSVLCARASPPERTFPAWTRRDGRRESAELEKEEARETELTVLSIWTLVMRSVAVLPMEKTWL